MMRLREHEAKPGLAQAALEGGRVEPDLHAQRREDIGRPDLDEAARLPCLATAMPQAATIIAASVEML
jgi:hypothetical protein